MKMAKDFKRTVKKINELKSVEGVFVHTWDVVYTFEMFSRVIKRQCEKIDEWHGVMSNE